MQQIAQKLKNGNIKIINDPLPILNKDLLLLKNYYSLVSTGTEGNTVKTARKGLINKAKERPQQVMKVLDTVKSQGLVQTYRAVSKKLEAYSPLGYSCVGEVVEIGDDATGFKIGDKVACGGLTASHAEAVAVPANLCVKLEPDADMKQAAYNTLGAIAMQGVRQADLRLGETCAVIGLGLIGQLTGQLLRATGVKTIGIDIDPYMVDIASKNGFDLTMTRDFSGIEDRILQFTGGIGCDAVIITAGSSSLDPINFAGAISRKRGTIVVVGAVPTGFDREPHFYKKELQVKMSCSYGPGRYDPQYEEKGIDYPAAYVRWTEKRNMQAFQELIYSKKIDVSYLTTHEFKLKDAPKAYDMMMAKSEPFVGILIKYDHAKPIEQKKIEIREAKSPTSQQPAASSQQFISIGFIGTGSYAQSHLLPNIPKSDEISLKGVLTSTGTSSRSVAERYGFEFCTGDEKDILENDEINTVFIATRHDSHAEFVLKAIEAGKNVFVEKPLCLKIEELKEIFDFLRIKGDEDKSDSDPNTMPSAQSPMPTLMVGYNRRFSPLAKIVKEKFGDGPMAMTYRVNAGAIAADSWIQDMEIGGGRIIGEVCHFVDFLTFINGSLPVSVHANVLSDPKGLNDTLTVSLNYQNGSIGTISYFANGDKSLPKERVEVYTHGCTAVIEDFKSLFTHAGGKKKKKKLMSLDKGQKNEVRTFIKTVKEGKEDPIPFEEIYNTSLVTFKILESIRTAQNVKI